MGKWIKRGLATVGALVLLVVGAVVALPFVIDPNALKTPLQDIAHRQGIALQLEGPISWRFYPDLGLALENIAIAPVDQADTPLARLSRGVASVELMPLLRKQVRVREIAIDGASIDLRVDANGTGNWESLGAAQDEATSTPTSETASGDALAVAVQSIRINDAALRYSDARSHQTFELRDVDLAVDDVNLQRNAFPLRVSFQLRASEPTIDLYAQAETSVAVDQALQQFTLGETQIDLRFADHPDAAINAQLHGEATLKPALAYNGEFSLDPVNVAAVLRAVNQALPPMQHADALSRVALSARLTGTDRQAGLDDVQLVVDETELSGTLGWQQQGDIPAINIDLRGSAFNVDHYLAPAGDDVSATASTANDADTPLPLETLRGINLDARLALASLTAMELTFSEPTLALTGTNGRWQLTSLTAGFYQSQMKAAGELDARQTPAPLQFAAQLPNLALQPLLQDVAEFGDLQGVVSGELTATASAVTVNQLLESLNANFVFGSPQLTFEGFNAERYYCEMAARLNDETITPQNWAPRTAISDVDGLLVFANSRLTIDTLRANLGNIVVQGKGFADLKQDNFRLRLPMLLAGESTSAEGCRIDSDFLLSNQVDIVGCQGALTTMDLGEQCGLDTEAVTTLARQAIRHNVQKRTDGKKQEVREELKEKLRERLGDENADSARDLLKNLLNR